MNESFLPLIALPNDTNDSDVSLVLSNGETIKASEAMKKYPLLKELLHKKLKLMADSPSASILTPQRWPVTLDNRNYVSISFYCSKDNHGRDTSASLVFAEGQSHDLIKLISTIETPDSLTPLKEEMIKMVENFSFKDYLLNESENADVKKKTFYLIAVSMILIGLVIFYLKETTSN